VVDLE
jgi:UDP-3-O-acyl-N-acetylglucosamine deacetylase